ncbi:MAG: TIGR00266 family protein [Lachnospirales bacterium]
MNYVVSKSTSTPIAKILLNKGERIRIERGSMIYHSQHIELEGKTNGGLMKSIAKSVVANESMFITTATSNSDGSEIGVAPGKIGSIVNLKCGEKQYTLNDGAFLACDSSIDLKMERQKKLSTALLGGTGGFFNMKTSGTGDLLINGFGEIISYEVSESNPLIFDNGHVVAWDSTLTSSAKMASGTFGFKSGEGIVIKFTGKGTVYIQSRNLEAFGSLLSPYILTSSS